MKDFLKNWKQKTREGKFALTATEVRHVRQNKARRNHESDRATFV